MIFTLAFLAIGGAISAYSAYQSSKEGEAISEYNAQVARNKGIAKERAIKAQNRIQRDLDRKDISALENIIGNSGIESGVGSPLLQATEQFADQQADRNEINRQALIAKATGGEQGKMFDRQAENIRSSRNLSLLAQGVNTASSMGGAYAQGD